MTIDKPEMTEHSTENFGCWLKKIFQISSNFIFAWFSNTRRDPLESFLPLGPPEKVCLAKLNENLPLISLLHLYLVAFTGKTRSTWEMTTKATGTDFKSQFDHKFQGGQMLEWFAGRLNFQTLAAQAKNFAHPEYCPISQTLRQEKVLLVQLLLSLLFYLWFFELYPMFVQQLHDVNQVSHLKFIIIIQIQIPFAKSLVPSRKLLFSNHLVQFYYSTQVLVDTS